MVIPHHVVMETLEEFIVYVMLTIKYKLRIKDTLNGNKLNVRYKLKRCMLRIQKRIRNLVDDCHRKGYAVITG
ncbi:hypothetical protein C1646_689424 [Rhizophagus diaphanus]|nr:hypothetical protein C1646_689424 [Rhizophagus diaphanus] [Rhizophagus sp. MUCL 43196]